MSLMMTASELCAQPAGDLEVPIVSSRLDSPRLMLSRGETFEAIRVLRRLEATRPRDGEAVLLLGFAYWLAGQKKLFVAKAEAAAGLLPRSPVPQYALGRHWLDDERNTGKAAAAFESALARDPQHAPSLYHLGWCRELDQRNDEAAQLYKRANSWLGHTGLARLALARSDLDEALAEARAGAALAPRQAQAQATLARVNERSGHLPEALRAYRTAIEADPNDPQLHYQLALCARKAGERVVEREALARFEELRAIYGSN